MKSIPGSNELFSKRESLLTNRSFLAHSIIDMNISDFNFKAIQPVTKAIKSGIFDLKLVIAQDKSSLNSRSDRRELKRQTLALRFGRSLTEISNKQSHDRTKHTVKCRKKRC